MPTIRRIAGCIVLISLIPAVRAETALQSAYLAESAAHGAVVFCRIERVRASACESAEVLEKSASAHYRAMMPPDMEGAYYRWELAAKHCENGCDDASFSAIMEAKAKYEKLELTYLSEGLQCKSKMDSALCFRVDDLQMTQETQNP